MIEIRALTLLVTYEQYPARITRQNISHAACSEYTIKSLIFPRSVKSCLMMSMPRKEYETAPNDFIKHPISRFQENRLFTFSESRFKSSCLSHFASNNATSWFTSEANRWKYEPKISANEQKIRMATNEDKLTYISDISLQTLNKLDSLSTVDNNVAVMSKYLRSPMKSHTLNLYFLVGRDL